MLKSKQKGFLILGAIIIFWLSATMAWILSDFTGLWTWGSFLVLLVMSGGILFLGFRALKQEQIPHWVIWLTLGAALVRLGAGVLWTVTLPVWGYDTEVQQNGYVMEDAYHRDTAAWELGKSEKSLLKAFTGYRAADQYGGLLFLSAAVYRFLGGQTHLPIMMVVVTAVASSLAVPFTWAFSKKMLDAETARWGAWGLALYPEAVLLGSSQMREAFMMTLTAIALYGLARYWEERSWVSLGWVLGALLLSLPLSPPLAGILLTLLTILALAKDDWRVLHNWRLWALIGLFAALIIGGLWLGWDQIAPRLSVERFGSPFAMVQYWTQQSVKWQAKLSRDASGWLQKIFHLTPDWMNLPFLLGYGITRPLLPAQLTAWGLPIWRLIGIWRAIGWIFLLPLLIYAPIRALRSEDRSNLLVGMSIAVWLGILIATIWGGGDQWDSPRYRVSFIALQMALATWIIVDQRRAPDPWMRRSLAFVLSILVWFIPWYLRRYTRFDQIFGWPVVDLFKLLGLGVATGVLYIMWDIAGNAVPEFSKHDRNDIADNHQVAK